MRKRLLSKKKMLLFVVCGFVLASCNQNDILDVGPTMSRPISFSPVNNPNLRAAAMITDSMRNFKVWGIYEDSPLTNLGGAIVSRTSATTPWTYSPMQEWPASGVVDFYAFSPASAGIEIGNFIEQNLSFEYTVPEAASQVDLMVAQKLGEQAGERTAPVNLHFQHTLSRVLLQVSSSVSGVSYKIHEVAIVNVHKMGKYSVSTGWDTSDGADNTVAGNLTGTAWATDSVALLDGIYTNVLGPTSSTSSVDNALMVLPQSTVLGQQEVDDDDSGYGGTGTVLKIKATCLGETNVTKTFYLPIDTLEAGTSNTYHPIEFKEGYQYTLKLRLRPGEMFDKYFVDFQGVEVSPWKVNEQTMGYLRPGVGADFFQLPDPYTNLETGEEAKAVLTRIRDRIQTLCDWTGNGILNEASGGYPYLQVILDQNPNDYTAFEVPDSPQAEHYYTWGEEFQVPEDGRYATPLFLVLRTPTLDEPYEKIELLIKYLIPPSGEGGTAVLDSKNLAFKRMTPESPWEFLDSTPTLDLLISQHLEVRLE